MVASQGKITQMLEDVRGMGFAMSESSLRNYIAALRKIFVLEDLSAWNPNLRSKTAIRSAPTRHFSDPSIAAAALRLGPADLVADLKTFGLAFESMCIRDLRVYSAALDGDVYHYRDRSGLEADAVVHLRDGKYALVEVKLGGETLIEEGAKSLTTLRDRVDAKRTGEPAFAPHAENVRTVHRGPGSSSPAGPPCKFSFLRPFPQTFTDSPHALAIFRGLMIKW